MIPLDRFNLDRDRIQYLADDAYTEEVFFVEEDRKVNKTNLFSIHSQKFECPVDLRQRSFRYALTGRRTRYLVYLKGNAWGRPPHWIFTAMHTEPVQETTYDQIHFWHYPRTV